MSLDSSQAASVPSAGAARLTLVSPSFSRRIGPALGGVACLILATVGTVDPSVPLAFMPRVLALAAGLLAGAAVAWMLARRRHASASRDALFPWLAIGAMVAGMVLLANSVSIFEHGTFATVTLLRGFLAALGVRFLTDGVLGPLPDIPLWGEDEAFDAAAVEEQQPHPSRRAS